MVIPALELRELRCVRGSRALFSGLNLSLPSGQLLRVTGANGAGKTSLLRMVCGLLLPEGGEILWRGARISELKEEFGRQLIYLGHAAALKDDLSAIENLVAAAGIAGIRCTDAQAAAALVATGLRGHERLPVRDLSQGQRRRVALARLMMSSDTTLWVLDEPFNALDAAATAWAVQLISTHVQRGGVVVLTSHLPTTDFARTLPHQELAL